MMLRLCQHHTIDQDSRDFTCLGLSEPRSAIRSTCAITSPSELRTAIAIASASSVSASFFHGDVSVRIGGRAADNSDIDRECAIEKKRLAFDLDKADEIVFGAVVDLTTTMARIDKRSKPHPCDMSGALCCDVAKQVRNYALRKIVRLNLIGNRQALKFRHQPPVSADHAPH